MSAAGGVARSGGWGPSRGDEAMPDIDTESEAFHDGYATAKQGEERLSPYPANATLDTANWLAGYDSADVDHSDGDEDDDDDTGTTTYRVYNCPEGSSPSYCGEFSTYEKAVAAAEKEPVGLEECLWDTARAAGHCGGLTAPGSGDESEPISWHGAEGWHCVVRVTR